MDAKAKSKARSSEPKKVAGKAVEQKRTKSVKNAVVKQESFRDKLKRKFNLFHSKGKAAKSTSSKKSEKPAQTTSPATNGSKQSKANGAANGQPKEKADKSVGPKASPQADKTRAAPKKESSTEKEKPKSTEVRSEPKKNSSQTSLALVNSDSSSESMESTESITTTGKAKTKAGKVKPQSLMNADQGTAVQRSQIASKIPKKKEEFKFEVHSNLGDGVIASPSAWMEFRAYKGQSKAAIPEATSRPTRLPDIID